jgi:hypothetical protein
MDVKSKPIGWGQSNGIGEMSVILASGEDGTSPLSFAAGSRSPFRVDNHIKTALKLNETLHQVRFKITLS